MYLEGRQVTFDKEKGTATIAGPCVVTGKPYSVTVPKVGLNDSLNGAHMQDAFPDLSADDREFLISGMSPEGWDETFGGEEELNEDSDYVKD